MLADPIYNYKKAYHKYYKDDKDNKNNKKNFYSDKNNSQVTKRSS